MANFLRKTLILNAKMTKIAPARVAQIMTNFSSETLILHDKTSKIAPAQVAQIITSFWRKRWFYTLKRLNLLLHEWQIMDKFCRKTLILHAKTPKFAPEGVAQIMTNFWSKMLILYAKTLKITSARVAQIITYFLRKMLILNA